MTPAAGSGGRVVITGGAGFLGAHLCDHYLAAGWDVGFDGMEIDV